MVEAVGRRSSFRSAMGDSERGIWGRGRQPCALLGAPKGVRRSTDWGTRRSEPSRRWAGYCRSPNIAALFRPSALEPLGFPARGTPRGRAGRATLSWWGQLASPPSAEVNSAEPPPTRRRSSSLAREVRYPSKPFATLGRRSIGRRRAPRPPPKKSRTFPLGSLETARLSRETYQRSGVPAARRRRNLRQATGTSTPPKKILAPSLLISL